MIRGEWRNCKYLRRKLINPNYLSVIKVFIQRFQLFGFKLYNNNFMYIYIYIYIYKNYNLK